LGRWGINAIAIAPDGRTAYAVEGGIADAIVPIDLSTRKVGRAIRVAGPRALGSALAITPDGRMAYVDSLGEDQKSQATGAIVHSTPSYVVPVDLRTATALRPLSLEPLSTGGHVVQTEAPRCLQDCGFDETIGGIAITADGRTAYVSDAGPTTSGIFSIDLQTEGVGSEIATGGAAGPLAIAPGAQTAYVAGNESVTSVDLFSHSAGRVFRLVRQGELFSSMAITPDGRTLVAAGYPELGLIDLENGTVKAPIHNPSGGADIAITSTATPAPPTTTSLPPAGNVAVPNVLGSTIAQAVGELQAVGLTNSVDDLNCHGSLGTGHVVGQSPTGGFRAAPGSRISLQISCGATTSGEGP
jgi:DNA-binding beta-propeller fold protein YncE